MKKVSLTFCLLLLILGCSEKSVDPIIRPNQLFEVSFTNEETDLEGRWTPVEFMVKNKSNEEIQIPGRVINNYGIFLSTCVQNFRNEDWVTIDEYSYDSLITIHPQDSVKSEFYVNEKGICRVLIPVYNKDTLYSEGHLVVNDIEDSINVDIYQISNSELLSFNVQNNTSRPMELRFNTYAYCHFSYLSYSLWENEEYKKLLWDDNNNEWTINGSDVFAICMAEMSSIYIDVGQEFQDTIYVKLPGGQIRATLSIPFARDWSDMEVIYSEFNYLK